MIGRQVILTNRGFTPDELYAFMDSCWDKEVYNSFVLGSPTDMNAKLYVMLPATPRHMVIVYSRSAGGMFRKENKVVLSVAMTKEGIIQGFVHSIPTRSIAFAAMKMGGIMSMEAERKGPAEEILLKYTEYMRGLLARAGYLKESVPVNAAAGTAGAFVPGGTVPEEVPARTASAAPFVTGWEIPQEVPPQAASAAPFVSGWEIPQEIPPQTASADPAPPKAATGSGAAPSAAAAGAALNAVQGRPKFCPYCGTKVLGRYCVNCGKQLW